MADNPPPEADPGTLCIFADSMIRPTLTMEDLRNEDGSRKPAGFYWSAVVFSVHAKPPDVYGKHPVVELYCGDPQSTSTNQECWRFYGVTIMLCPGVKTRKSGPYKYIMVYDKQNSYTGSP